MSRRSRVEVAVVGRGEVALWRGSARTMPLGAFAVAPSELVAVLRKLGAPTRAIVELAEWADAREADRD